MRLSKVTMEILKNFASINQGIIFHKGNILKTMNVMKNTFVSAMIPDEIPVDFAIYDLNEFLGTYSLNDNYDIEFEENRLKFSTTSEYTYYNFSSPSVIVSPGTKSLVLPSKDKVFTLTKETFNQVVKVATVMKLKDIAIDQTGITIFNRNSVGNQHHINLNVECETESSPALLKVENLKLIPVDYTVAISDQGLSQFISNSEEYKIDYFIALEID